MDKKKDVNGDNEGGDDSLAVVVSFFLMVAILVIFFYGKPDLHDCIRLKLTDNPELRAMILKDAQ